jgi:acetyl-CoA acetyltransferase
MPEAFAAQNLPVTQRTDLDDGRVNRAGGGIAALLVEAV